MSRVESLLLTYSGEITGQFSALPVDRDDKRQKTSAIWTVTFVQILSSLQEYKSVINYLSIKQGISQKVFDFRE